MYVEHNPDKYKTEVIISEHSSAYSSVQRSEEEYREARKASLEKRQEELQTELGNINMELDLIERGVTPPSFYRG